MRECLRIYRYTWYRIAVHPRPVVSLYLSSSYYLPSKSREREREKKKRHVGARQERDEDVGRARKRAPSESSERGLGRNDGEGQKGRETSDGPLPTFSSFLERSFFPLCPEARKLRDFLPGSPNPFEGSAYTYVRMQ